MGCCEGENGLIKIKALEKYLPPNKFYNSFFFPHVIFNLERVQREKKKVQWIWKKNLANEKYSLKDQVNVFNL